MSGVKNNSGGRVVSCDFESVDSGGRNPLHCLICNNVFVDPRLLSCYHSFCAKCLDGRIGDTKLICPLCGKVTCVKEGSGPAPDFLLRYLIHSSTDSTHPICANCDNKSHLPIYYCNTCGQVLCNGCREETHRAKMFSAHDVIPISRYNKENPKKCSVHGEHFIMFSSASKCMLCINCYRDTGMEARLSCVDLDTAYSQGCRKLDRAVLSLRDLQVAVRDGITLLKNVLEELRRNSESEKSALNAVCQTILDALTKTKENLIRDVDSQVEGKDRVIRTQLATLRSVLPTIKLHLTMCASLSKSCSKYDFVDLAYPLLDRLSAITHMGYPTQTSGQSSSIKSNYKSEIARTLEPWVDGGVSVPVESGEGSYSTYYPMTRSTHPPPPPPNTSTGSNWRQSGVYAAPSTVPPPPPPVAQSGRKTPTSSKKLEGIEEQFLHHCRSFSTFVNECSVKLGELKEEVSELHGDVTTQRGSPSSYILRTEGALREGLLMEEELNRRQAEMERIKKNFETSWNEHMRQVRVEQDVFQSQMNDLMSLKAEVKTLSSILTQLQSFLKSVGSSGSGAQNLQNSQNSHQSQQSTHSQTNEITDSTLRAESGSQVTPSLVGVDSSFAGKGVQQGPNNSQKGVSCKKELKNELVSRLGRFSISKVPPHHGSSSGSSIITTNKLKGGGDDYLPMEPIGSSKRGIFNQLIDRVRHSKDDRKKSTSSSVVSSCGSSSVPTMVAVSTANAMSLAAASSVVAASNRAAARAAMHDAQIQYGFRDNSAVAALRRVSSTRGRPPRPSIKSSSRPTFIKSKSDDERPPTRLSRSNRARSVAAIDPQSLLRSISSSSKEASRIISLYQSLLQEKERGGSLNQSESRTHFDSQSEKSRLPASYYDAQSEKRTPYDAQSEKRASGSAYYDAQSEKRPSGSAYYDAQSEKRTPSSAYYDAQSEKRTPSSAYYDAQSEKRAPYDAQLEKRAPSSGYFESQSDKRRPGSGYYESDKRGGYFESQLDKRGGYFENQSGKRTPGGFSLGRRRDEEDDYQQIVFGGSGAGSLGRGRNGSLRNEFSSKRKEFEGKLPEVRSHTMPSTKTEVRVFVHSEPPPPLSKSLEEHYLFGFLDEESGSRSSNSSEIGKLTRTKINKKGGGGGGSEESLVSVESVGVGSRKSSIDFDRRSVVTVRRAQKQHSWEAAQLPEPPIIINKPPSSSSTPILSPELGGGGSSSSSGRRGPFDENEHEGLRKRDSFEGHEEAVRSLVQAVKETRTMKRKMQSN